MHDGPDLARRSRSIAAISILAVILIDGGHARAQSAEAEAMFEHGDKLMTAGKLAEACEAFEASNRIEPRAGTLLRLGECREKNRQLASAWSAYKDALTRAKDPRKRDAASAKVTELEPKLSYLTISVPAASRVDGLTITRNDKPLDPALWNRALPMDGGDYAISVRAPGNDEWKTTVTVPVDGGKLRVDVPKLEKRAEPVSPAALVVTKPTTPVVSDEVTRPAYLTTRRKIAIGVGGAGALSLVTGIVLGTQAKSKQNAALALCPAPQNCADADRANALNDAGYRRALGANIVFGVAAAAAIGAGVLWFTGGPETAQHRVAVVPTIAPGETGVVVQGRF